MLLSRQLEWQSGSGYASKIMSRILLVEDEPELARLIKEWLEEDYYSVEVTGDGLDGFKRMSANHFDVVVLDIMLPGLNGIDVCRRYRETGGKSPIIMLTAKRALSDKERGLDGGADDYLTKPFKMRELSARIRALMRRESPIKLSTMHVGDLCLDRATHRVTRGTIEIKLLPKEFALLEALMKNAGEVLATEALIVNVWGSDSEIVPETIRSYVRMLRQKIDLPGLTPLIQNVHGVGYKIEASDVR
jgi:two-component system, OmpR family, response regulator